MYLGLAMFLVRTAVYIHSISMVHAGISRQKIIQTPIHKAKLGLIVETKSLPLHLQCDVNYKYIRIGEMKMNAVIIPNKMRKLAEEECKITMEGARVENGIHVGPSCQIWFHGELPSGHFEILRASYECLHFKMVLKSKVKTAVQKVARKFIHISCNFNQAIIRIHSVKFGDDVADVDVMRFPELDHLGLEQKCYRQILQGIHNGTHRKGRVDCFIKNKENYGSELKIEYSCEKAPYENLLGDSVADFQTIGKPIRNRK